MIYNGKEYEVVSRHDGYAIIKRDDEVLCAALSDLKEKEQKTQTKRKASAKV